MDWFALYVAPRAEERVTSRLLGNGMEAFCPFQAVRLRRKLSNGRTALAWEKRPLFPRYVFVKSRDFLFLTRLQGITSIVGIAGLPIAIPEAVIEFCKSRSQEPIDLTALSWKAEIGQEVLVASESSPFYGLVGKIAGLTRLVSRQEVDIWLNMFGASRVVRVPASVIDRRSIAATGEQALAA
jgi:transcription antitermination factor NusG